MASKHLVVEKIAPLLIKVYWNNEPDNIVWEGLEFVWEENLRAYAAEKPSSYPLDWLYGYDIVYL